MIVPKNIRLKDFSIIKDLYLDFEKGMFHVITGDNGSGKSSFINALALVLFEYKSGDSYKEYVRFGTEFSKVEFNALFKGKPINFDVTINASQNKLPLERKMTYDGKEYVNSEVKTFLSENFDIPVIQNIMFSIQKEYGNVSTMTPSVLRDMLQSMFNISFEDEIKQIRSNIDVLQSEVNSYAVDIAIIERTKYDLENSLILAEEDEIETIQKSLESSKVTLEIYKQNAIHLNIKSKYEANKIAYEEAIESIKTFKDEITKLKDKKSILENSLQDYKSEYDFTNETIGKIRHDLNIAKEKSTETKIELANLNKDYENVSLHKADHERGLCIRCQRPYSSDEDHEFNTLLEDKMKLVNSTKSSLDKILQTCNELDTDLKNSVKRFSYLDKSIKDVNNDITDIGTLIGIKTNMMSNNEGSIKFLETELDQMKSSYETVKNTSEITKTQIQTLEKNIENNEMFISNEKIKRSKNADIILRNMELINKQKSDDLIKNDLIRKTNDNQIKINSNLKAIDILSVDMVNHVIVKMCSELEEYINEFIDSIKSNLRVKLLKTKKGVELYVTPNNASSDKPSEWSTIKMCSGFEKDLISLAFKIALARAYNLRILILDEIDSAATSENSGRLFSLIAKITDFDSVIVVSHKDSVRNVLVEEGQNVVAYEVTNGNYELIG